MNCPQARGLPLGKHGWYGEAAGWTAGEGEASPGGLALEALSRAALQGPLGNTAWKWELTAELRFDLQQFYHTRFDRIPLPWADWQIDLPPSPTFSYASSSEKWERRVQVILDFPSFCHQTSVFHHLKPLPCKYRQHLTHSHSQSYWQTLALVGPLSAMNLSHECYWGTF